MIVEVKEDDEGNLYIELPDDLMKQLSWKEGDDLEFYPGDGYFTIKKIEKE